MSLYTRRDGAVTAEQQAVRASEVIVGAAAVTSSAWIETITHINEVVVLIASIGGAILVWWRVYVGVREWLDNRKNGTSAAFDKHRRGEF